MDTKSIAAVLLKVAGLILVAAGAVQLPNYFPVRLEFEMWSPTESILAALLTVGPGILLGICFWFFPGTISNKIVAQGPGEPAPHEFNAILVLSIAVLGLFLVAHGTIDVVFHLATMFRLRHLNPGIGVTPPSVFAGAIAAGAEVVIGLVFCIGRRKIGRMIERARG